MTEPKLIVLRSDLSVDMASSTHTDGVPVPYYIGADTIHCPPRKSPPYGFSEVETHTEEYKAALMPEKERWHGPLCLLCNSRETSYIGPGRRHCKRCGLVEFRITADGYRGVRKVNT